MLPREKIIKYGPDFMSDEDLLAIMIGVGTVDKSVFEIAKDLVNNYGIEKLLNLSYKELSKIKGIGPSKATKLMACFTLAKRCKRKISDESLSNSKIIYEYVVSEFLFLEYECLYVLFLDCKLRVIDKYFEGGKRRTKVTLNERKIISEAIRLDAFAVVLAHNHPSGDVKPSKVDISSTIVLKGILEALEINLLDHVVVSEDKYFSMSDNFLI